MKINNYLFRENIVEYASMFRDKKYAFNAMGPDEFDEAGFTWYIFESLFDIDINKYGYGMDNTTKQLTNNLGILSSYIEKDSKKKEYIKDIKKGSLVFFHTKSLEDNQPLTNNKYPGDVGIYLGDKRFIHADSNKKRIIIDEIKDYWLDKMVASRDIIANKNQGRTK
jgi:cell wall-associated NlpC family hydrolase